MEFTGERFVPLNSLLNDEIAFEHLHRYHAVSQIVSNKIVLDIACGEGYGSSILAKFANKVIGVDIDPAVVEEAKNHYSEIANIQFLTGGAGSIPLADQSMDMVVSYETIEHLDESIQKKFLPEIIRVLRKDGMLVISTPDIANYSERYGYANPFHVKEFSCEEFFNFLGHHFEHIIPYLQGYEIVSAITEDDPKKINKLHVIDWNRPTTPFNRKYLIAICSNKPFIRNPEFSSVVFQVNKDFMKMTDRIVQMEAHILELGTWGRQLDKQIEEKNILFSDKLKEFEERQAIVLQKSAEELNDLKRKNNHLQIEVSRLQAEHADKNTIIDKQKEQVHNLYHRLDAANIRLSEIYESDGWKVLEKYYTLKGKLLPEHSQRYKILKRIVNKLRGKKETGIVPKALKGSDKIVDSQRTRQGDVANVYEVIEFSFFEFPSVSIVIPSYNGWPVLYNCLESIRSNSFGASYEIIIADDASTDGTVDIEKYVKNISLISNEKNLGFLQNCNRAAGQAKGKYILFLNNDTQVKPGWLSSMVDLMETDKTVGMVGSKLIYPNGKLQEAGGIIWRDASGWNFGHNQDPDAPEFNYVKEADYVSGASIIIRTNLWNEIGGFDERFTPAYCEDSDLAFEVRKRGYKVVYQPQSEVIHFEGYTHGTDWREGITGKEIKAYQKFNNEKFREKWKDILEKEHFPNGENVFWARDRSQHRKTILVIDHYVPHFDKDAGSRTVFNYLKSFASLNLNVKFIGDNFYRHEPYTGSLQQMGIEVLYGPNYANNWQQWIRENHDKFDFVLLNRPHITIKYIDFIRKNTRAKILYYGHDLHFVREQKQYQIENDSRLLESQQEWKRTETYIFNQSDIILTPSDDEKMAITDILGETQKTKTILPYSFENFPDPVIDFSGRENILFVGGFAHKPNVDAVLWFCTEIWPAVQEKIPKAKFVVAGSNTPEQIFQLASENIIIKGHLTAEQLDEIYLSARIIAIPLRYGAGVKGKTVEALHKGVPLVTTSSGLEGLPGDFSFLQVTDQAGEFANRISTLYKNEEELKEQSVRSIAYIRDNFSEDKAKMILKNILEIR